MPPGHHSSAGRGARWFGIHAHESHALIRQFVYAWRLGSPDKVKFGDAKVTEADVIDQNIEDIGTVPILLLTDIG